MKAFITIFITTCSLTLFGQVKDIAPIIPQAKTTIYQQFYTPGKQNGTPPVYFVDSVKISQSYFRLINADDIESINVSKDKKYPNGAIYIALKDKTKLNKLLQQKLLSLNDFAKAALKVSSTDKQIVYMLDDKLITDTTGISIPATYLEQVKILTPQEAPYFHTTFPKALIMKISSKPADIYIRGR
ncbi:MAG: hypothetical protein EOP46_05015 [Sphingobacteriaceae bacterium]|nr:MAG: hypothetical protein EOP46_05015 [Sphingobacteriaceae bacterium]